MNKENSSEYVDVYIVKDMLEIKADRNNHDITKLLSPFVQIIKETGKNNLFNINDVKNFLEKAKNFYNEHYIYNQISDFLPPKHFLNKKGIKSFKLPPHYGLVLNKSIKRSSNHTTVFRKDIIDVAIEEYAKVLEKCEKEKVKKELQSEEYICVETVREILEINDNKKNYQILKILSPFIRTLKIQEHIHLYNASDVKNYLEDAKKFYSEHYLYNDVDGLLPDRKIFFKNGIIASVVPTYYNLVLTKSIKRDLNKICYVLKKDIVDKFLKEYNKPLKVNGEEYVDIDTLRDMLEINDRKRNTEINKLLSPFIRTIKLKNNSSIFNKNDIKDFLEEVKEFYNEHYLYCDISDSLPSVRFLNKKGIKSFKTPAHYNLVLTKSIKRSSKNTTVFRKDIIDMVIKEYAEVLEERKRPKPQNIEKKVQFKTIVKNNCEYVNTKLALKLLSFTHIVPLRELRNDNLIDFFTIASEKYYKVSDIENIINLRTEFLKEYIMISSAIEYFDNKGEQYRCHYQKLKRYPYPNYCRGLGNVLNSFQDFNSGCFKISDIDKVIEDCKKSKAKHKLTNITGVTLFETFEYRLNAHPNWNGFDENSEYTSEKVMLFVKTVLDKTKRPKDTGKNDVIGRYLALPIAVVDILRKNNVEEIYLLTDSKINFYMNTIHNKSTKKIFYRFLKDVNADLRKLGLAGSLNFNFSNITNPNTTPKVVSENDNKKDIYDFSVYADVFNYLIDIDKHVPIIIEEFKNHGTRVHASIWLYAMLHLNNAWRNGDCDRFPELKIKDLIEEYKIESIEWFSNNRLTLAQSKGVIFRVRQWEMRISKTQMNGVFFCSDELSPAFATAVIILTLLKYGNNIIPYENSNEKSIIMNFDNKDNSASKTILKNFFVLAEIKDFVFKSRKFNRTIMTYVYLLANLKGDSKALIYCQELRRHVDIENTSVYIDFDIKKIESLSNQLFARGEFGYIPALLTEKVFGHNIESFEDITNQVIKINTAFGNVSNINQTLSFLNTIKSDRQNVIDMISEKSFKECQEIFTDLFTRRSIGGDGYMDIQCLFGNKGCQNINVLNDEECSCFDCPYHIPSIYALTRLCEELIRDYRYYLGIPDNIKARDFKEFISTYNPPKLNKQSLLKVGLRIERRKVILIEAIKKFSKEYVYRCIDIEGDDFRAISDFIKLDFYTSFPELIKKNCDG